MINVWIDELTPCLKDAVTGEFVPTEVIRIVRKSFLNKYTQSNGWYTDWADLLDDCEVYALVVKRNSRYPGYDCCLPGSGGESALYGLGSCRAA